MVYAADNDPLCYPGTTVLINLADLTDPTELDDFEFSMYLTRAEEPLPDGNLGYDHYRAIHHHLFQDIYAWAGEPRTIRTGKAGNWFCYPEHLDRQMERAFSLVASRDLLGNLPKSIFAEGAADLLAEINAGHSFREGNGRTQLAYLKLLVVTAGFTFNDDALDPVKVMNAMIASFGGRLEPLIALINDIVA
jgi:cell filamentation protein